MTTLRKSPRPKYSRGVYWPTFGEVGVFVAGLFAINAIFLSDAFHGTRIDPNAASQLGGFVGGYVGSVLTLLSILLLIRTLREQQRTNRRQGFEAKYFMLLQLHRNNVNELTVADAAGRKVFVLLFREWREVLPIVKETANKTDQNLSNQDAAAIAYYCLYFGTGPNSSRMLRAELSGFKSAFVTALEERLKHHELKEAVRLRLKLPYTPFDGHQSRLGHYYRHLYQTIGYIDGQDLEIPKYEYAKTVRAQLSTHEQALLLLNSLTPLGESWWRNGFMKRYRMVQNIPSEFFDANELRLEDYFPADYFEAHERRLKLKPAPPDRARLGQH